MLKAPGPSKAVLLVNLGTTTAPTAPALRSFLGEFLADRRVIDVPRFIWYPILYGFILPFRPVKILPLYNHIWIKKSSGVVINGKTEGSPLALYTESLTDQVRAIVEAQSHGDVVVRHAMRYGAKNIPAALKSMHEEFPGIHELVVLPLFPQYSSTTTACIYDEVFRFYSDKNRRCVPGLRTIRDYADHPAYVESVATSLLSAIKKYVTAKMSAAADGWKTVLATHMEDVALVFSYHSIPIRYAEEGDDYPQRCEATTRAVQLYLEKETGVPFADSIVHVYQSQFGNQPWIGPKLVEAVAALPAAPSDARKQKFCEACHNTALAKKQVNVCFAIAPGFAVDCVETIHEIAEDASGLFKEHGGRDFIYVPCLNDSEGQVKAITAVLKAAE
ncbi:Ferrochelatase-like protein [Leptomonas pyrrhocoris]|uniref:Ferrochelatase n=1 Tax=Leptomonas pyrrhocoris TaxID=157538 RepID=A0A0M9FUT5_LEPPY|nr:Ferrochelatase-like protein [Leptomonas pyrrhocoris]XP_015654755.1 Ferrochelatase-like protein [Leptomonas pyrrhocoris]XP_015654756.1 Ferrochelatase-like protein [Leptomonas pyrrhocoris]XP_015654757.1 Ferrochelatase-like protein [Leptomonas pyrrhocoris]KPA76315.1 Ferrochelatase-like protein [Leptomonas pyrrhocoris]KPA76316.1 Ferrochelatase-like protein [Leptomonas pyrrhocoris]KPA76317.1 Ferrochelatase-like protein [Leptomonas pyrrhocoris]KPA76318.1 Ferrochelatase-like protein [Leptomonas |eukprot:XP_015654754.1 Ferrochelatase-like protein [Leptomonas pyrrhocoris]